MFTATAVSRTRCKRTVLISLFKHSRLLACAVAISVPGFTAGTSGNLQAVEPPNPQRLVTLKDTAVIQNGKSIPIKNGKVKLKRAPFSFLFTFKKKGASSEAMVGLNAAPVSVNYEAVRANKPIGQITPFFPGTGVPEFWHNKDKSLFISPEAHNHWVYIDKEKHRFSSVTISGDQVLAMREIEKITYNGQTLIPIEKSGLKKLYLVMMRFYFDGDSFKNVEVQRDQLILEFE